MKKIIVLTLVALSFSASAALATTVAYTSTDTTAATLTAGTAPNSLVFKLSKNVLMNYKSATDLTGYSIAAYHNKGTKTFGSSSGDSKIFENVATAVDAPDAPVGTASANFSGWSAL